MKLRIQDNSIRLRLTRGEVDRVQREGQVTAAAAFPGGSKLRYALESATGAGGIEASFTADRLVVRVPEPAVRQWASSEQVSMAGEQPLDSGERLAILVEKDFACLTPREGEDESDMFPHPLAGQEAC